MKSDKKEYVILSEVVSIDEITTKADKEIAVSETEVKNQEPEVSEAFNDKTQIVGEEKKQVADENVIEKKVANAKSTDAKVVDAKDTSVKATDEKDVDAKDTNVKAADEKATDGKVLSEAKKERKSESSKSKNKNKKSNVNEIVETDFSKKEKSENTSLKTKADKNKANSPKAVEVKNADASLKAEAEKKEVNLSTTKEEKTEISIPDFFHTKESKVASSEVKIEDTISSDSPEPAQKKKFFGFLKRKKSIECEEGTYEEDKITHKEIESVSTKEENAHKESESVSTKEENAHKESESIEEAAAEAKPLWKNTRFLLASLAVIVVLILYSCVAYNYRNVFLMGTTINGIDCSDMTVEEVEAVLKSKVEDYELSIIFRDGTTEVISGESMNYQYVSDGSIQKLMDKQIPMLWIVNFITSPEYEVAEAVEFDRGLLASEYYALSSTSEEKMVSPTNAYVTYEGDKFIVVPEDEGNEIDHHAFLLKINEVVAASGTEIVAEDCEVYANPTIFSDSADLAKECEQLNELAVVSITYTLANGEYVLDGNEVRNWLKVDEDGNYSITDEEMTAAIEDFVDRLADEVNTVGTERPFKATRQGNISVSGGSYGWKINKKEEAAQIAEEIASRAIVTREPCYSSREVTTDNNGFGDTYIEIDLSNQHLWYYIDGELYVESDFVSGTYYNSSRRTPGGIYLLTYKQKDRVLRGQQKEDGTYEYESPVSYWMPFNGGIGLHDASWRSSFGGSIYKYSGSHGCINLPYKKAQAIYAEIDKETPIICFY